jgi:hypothetical protein
VERLPIELSQPAPGSGHAIAALGRRGWTAICLAVLLAAGCSSSSGGTNGGSDASDAAADAGGDAASPDAGQDADAQTPDGTGDTTADAEPDGLSDVAEEVAADADAADVAEEVVADSGDDTGDASDIPPSPYEFCPYDEPVAAGSCDTICAKVATCGGDEADCLTNCQEVGLVVSAETSAALVSCVNDTACGDVPEGQDLGQYCFQSIVAAATPSEAATTACQTVDTAVDTCQGENTNFADLCLYVARVVRDDAITKLADCASAECVYIIDCVDAALCGLY